MESDHRWQGTAFAPFQCRARALSLAIQLLSTAKQTSWWISLMQKISGRLRWRAEWPVVSSGVILTLEQLKLVSCQ